MSRRRPQPGDERNCYRCGMPLKFFRSPIHSGHVFPGQRVKRAYAERVDLTGEASLDQLEIFNEDHPPIYINHYETCPYASEFRGKSQGTI